MPKTHIKKYAKKNIKSVEIMRNNILILYISTLLLDFVSNVHEFVID